MKILLVEKDARPLNKCTSDLAVKSEGKKSKHNSQLINKSALSGTV